MKRRTPLSRLYAVVLGLGALGFLAAASANLAHLPRAGFYHLAATFAVFSALACVSELLVALPRQDTPPAQRSVTAARMALIVLLPSPLALLVGALASLLGQLRRKDQTWDERLVAVAHTILVIGTCSSAYAWLGHARLWRGHLLSTPDRLVVLLALYSVLDLGLLTLLFPLSQRGTPAHAWGRSRLVAVGAELLAGATGILAALTWSDQPFLLLLLLPLIATLAMVQRALTRAEDRAQALHSVAAVGEALQLQQSLSDLLEVAAAAVLSIVDAVAVTAYLYDDEDPALLRRVATTPRETGDCGPPRHAHPPLGEGIREGQGPLGRTLLIPIEDRVAPEEGHDESAKIAAMLYVAGVPATLDRVRHDALRLLVAQAIVGMHNLHLKMQVQARSHEDALTGLLNHHAFQSRLEQEIARAVRIGEALALVLVDLDDFTQINNAHGYEVGDDVLIRAADMLRINVRDSDVLARYASDEFMIILPATPPAEALAIGERVRAAITRTGVSANGKAVRLTASVGVASIPVHADTREGLIRACQQALVAAKHAGGGCVCQPDEASPADMEQSSAHLAVQLHSANVATVQALAAAVDAKDHYTRGHSQRVATYAAAIAQALDLSGADIARIRLAGRLHDVGKIGVPDAVLVKTGKLLPEEHRMVEQHPVIGERMLGAVPFLREILPAVRHHHERWDGRGYPDKLVGAEIPLDAAIIGVADSFDAMTSTRTYREALSAHEAQRRLREGAGTQFNPRVVAAFEKAFASGTLHLLSTGMTGPLNARGVGSRAG